MGVVWVELESTSTHHIKEKSEHVGDKSCFCECGYLRSVPRARPLTLSLIFFLHSCFHGALLSCTCYLSMFVDLHWLIDTIERQNIEAAFVNNNLVS